MCVVALPKPAGLNGTWRDSQSLRRYQGFQVRIIGGPPSAVIPPKALRHCFWLWLSPFAKLGRASIANLTVTQRIFRHIGDRTQIAFFS